MHEKRVLFATKIGLAIFWTLLIAYVMAGSITESPIKLPFKNTINLLAIAPEGWGFFTRNPREPALNIYKHNGIEWTCVNSQNSNPSNLFGLKRDPRIQGVELSFLLQQIPDTLWISCSTELNKFLTENSIIKLDIKNDTPVKSLCGEVIIQRQPPVPWAWSKSRDNINMPSKVIMLNINCH